MDERQPAPPPSPAALPAHAAPAPLATSLSLLLPLGVVIAFLLVVLGTATAVARWCLFDEAGSQWLVQRLPVVQVQGFRGALLGDRWQAERVHIPWGGKADPQSVTLEGLDATGLRWTWRPDDHAWVRLEVGTLSLRRLSVDTGKPDTGPTPMPQDIAWPLHLRVQQARVAELRLDQQAPFTELAAQDVVLDPQPGAAHTVGGAQALWHGVQIEASGRIGTRAPLPLSVEGVLRPAAGGEAPRWAAALRAGGSLDAMQITGTLRGVPLPGREPPAVDLAAGLRPLLAWPLSTLDLQTRELDLAALAVEAPQTRLSGSATLAARAKNAPVSATAELVNALPGRWNERRLPVQRLNLSLRGELQRPDRLELQEFQLALSDGVRSAGTVTGSATWQRHELQLDARLANVVPQRLDGRAAAMQLAGPVSVSLRGLPSPDGAPQPAAAASGPAVAWKLDLEGTLDAAPQPVRLAMEGSATDQLLQITRLRASSGSASADMQATLQRAPGKGTDWRLESAGSLVDFDPQPWWPGDTGTAWRQGPHRLSAGWAFDVRLPGTAGRLPVVELAQRLAGTGTLRVHDSVLAGVPVAADIKLGYTQAAAPTSALLRAALQLGGNALAIDGRGDPTGTGQADRWRLDIKAEALAALAPLARLHPALADWVPRRGIVEATVSADGRWPNLRTEGSVRIAQLLLGSNAVAQGNAQWRLDTGGDRPLAMKLDLAGVQLGASPGGMKADHLRGEVTGTLADHRIELSAALPLLPPTAAVRLLGVQAQSGTRARLAAQGAWQPESGGGGRWRARVERLVVGSWDGSATEGPPASVWAQAQELRTELQFDAGGQLLALRAEPGRVQLADAGALRWDEVRLDLRGAQPQIQLRADLEPFALAPLLARLQPTMGWAGDIRLGARIDIRAAERFDADLVFERKDGDLHIAGGEGMQLLGLTDLKFTVAAHDGAWSFTPVFKGRSLGEVTGTVRVQTTPERRWPHAEAPLSGDVQARVADLGIWAAWVPPGWRLGGELRTVAMLGGRFGEPRYTGEITGTGLSVRNLLQGVNVSDGQVGIRLEGDRATVERFTLKGGDGSLTITGGASLLNPVPEARLTARAERFRLVGRVDRLAIVSGQAELALNGEQLRVDGRFKADEALYDASRGDAPSLDDDVTVRRPGDPERAPEEARANAQRRNVMLSLDLDLGERTRVKGRGLDTALVGNVRLTTPPGRVELRGTINTRDGTYAAYGQKLTLERGILAFGGPYDDPRLDILALRPNIDQRVGVAITGTALSPRVRLFAEPDLSETEKLSWLVLGRAPDGLGRTDTALLQRAAVALLSGEGEAPTDALMRNLGIDELSLKQSDGDVRETVVSLGKQLSRRWYVGYERGVNATTGTWQLIYRIAQRFTLRAQSGLENSLDVIWTWRFQETPAEAAMRKSTVTPP